MRRVQASLLGLILLILCLPAQAIITGELIMIRSDKPFAQAMHALEVSIKKQGYTLSRVQRVDTGLALSGYSTDKYRIVFFGKTEQMKTLTKTHSELIPYLPLKIAIFAEADETLLVTSDPSAFTDLYPHSNLRDVFKQWHEDIISIMKNVLHSDK